MLVVSRDLYISQFIVIIQYNEQQLYRFFHPLFIIAMDI